MTLKFNFDQIGYTATAPFFAQGGAPAPLRHSGRAFFGDGAAHSQGVDGTVTGGSWAQSFTVSGRTITDWDYGEDLGRVVAVTSVGSAFSGMARTLGSTIDGFGGKILAVNDGHGRKLWGLYLDAVKGVADASEIRRIWMQRKEDMDAGAYALAKRKGWTS